MDIANGRSLTVYRGPVGELGKASPYNQIRNPRALFHQVPGAYIRPVPLGRQSPGYRAFAQRRRCM